MSCPACGAAAAPDAFVCAGCGATLPAGETLAQTTPPGTPGSYVITLDLRPGAVFHSRYEVLEPLGRGGMGMVFRARDRVLEETVAIKVLRPDVAQDARMAERFRSEIKLARRVRHRNVCAIHDYGEDQGLLFISMELVEGSDLKHLVRERGGLPHEQAYDICAQVAEGLQAVHEAGIVHRDLKTPNIMIDGTGLARLMDFGVAKRLNEGSITSTGQVVGTPEYMSPEQAQGHKVDARSDIYALGVVVYEVFTGQVPFRGETPISTILKHINEPPPLDGPRASALPPGVRDVLRKALAKDPKRRYDSVRDMGEALRAARSPSRRQQPVNTDALRAPTLRGSSEPTRKDVAPPRAPRARRMLQPWLLAVPAVAVAGGAMLMMRATGMPPSPATAASPAATFAAMPSTAPTREAFQPPPTTIESLPVPTIAARVTPSPVTAAARPTPTALPARTPPPTLAKVLTPTATPAATPAPSATPAPTPAAPSAPGQLQVVVLPWGEVTVDGRSMGQTPLDLIALPPGSHRVRVRHPTYEVWEREVVIRSGQVEKVRVDFSQLPRRN